MAKITIIQKKKMLEKLKNIGIVTEKDILNLKVYKAKELKEQGKVTTNDLEIIWNIQETLMQKDILKILEGGIKWEKLQKHENCIKK